VNSYLEQLFSLSGRTAIVTGGTRGIGAAIAEALSGAGANTIAVGRGAPQAPTASIRYEQCDVCGDDEFAQLCARVLGGVSGQPILVNAAGMTRSAVDETQVSTVFDETLDANLKAVFRCCQAAIPFMKGAGGGAIINVTSIGSVLGFPANPGYVAAKGGLRMLTRALALDLAASNIRVNNIAPGYIRTAMTESSYSDPAKHAERLARMMIPRWGEPADLAGAAVFLASDAARYVTAADIFVDGGWSARGL
jgi:NAD(P)-dependent dehydrogenase (short-subunit alcohol dehydrogenase family)